MQNLDTIPSHMLVAVDRLLLQYQEYRLLTEAIKREPAGNSRAIALLQRDRQQISDEMTFGNHIIWLMYKHKAYQHTPKALTTLGALITHCAPVDDICHQRWEFLRKHVPEIATDFPSSTPLGKLYQEPKLLTLLSNLPFLERWKDQEFYRHGSSIRKWKKHYSRADKNRLTKC